MSPAIETRSLRKVYPPPPKRRGGPVSAGSSAGVVAVDALDLTIDDGEFFGMLGPNGAGKTTTIGILTTRVRPTGGEAVVAGANVVSAPAAVRRRIGVVPQRPTPYRRLTSIVDLGFQAPYI